jgi:hypothetical protein
MQFLLLVTRTYFDAMYLCELLTSAALADSVRGAAAAAAAAAAAESNMVRMATANGRFVFSELATRYPAAPVSVASWPGDSAAAAAAVNPMWY